MSRMIDQIDVVETVAIPAAVIHIVVPRSDIEAAMTPAVAEVQAALKAQGLAPAGPLFAHHLRMDVELFDFEVGYPVAGDFTPAGRVERGALPAGKVARAIYKGRYEALQGAWEEFDMWLDYNELVTGPALWESYIVGPESGADPADLVTELNVPLAR